MKNIIRVDIKISIHAPREGGDFRVFPEDTTPFNFNPRPREGGDTNTHTIGNTNMREISIHAPREGGDCIWQCYH